MAESFDLYGSTLDLESARRAAEAALGIFFEPHESSYRGGEYYRCMDSFILQRNEELDGEPKEPDFPGVPTLLFVSAVADADAVREQLICVGHFEHLRRDRA